MARIINRYTAYKANAHHKTVPRPSLRPATFLSCDKKFTFPCGKSEFGWSKFPTRPGLLRANYPDLGSDASSVWDFRTRFSDVNSWRNRRWRGKISAVFWSWQMLASFIIYFVNLLWKLGCLLRLLRLLCLLRMFVYIRLKYMEFTWALQSVSVSISLMSRIGMVSDGIMDERYFQSHIYI